MSGPLSPRRGPVWQRVARPTGHRPLDWSAMRRTLTLRGETLAPLTVDELTAVAGGDATGGCPWTFHVRECLSIDPGCIKTTA